MYGPDLSRFFLLAIEGIRDLVRSRGLVDLYKSQVQYISQWDQLCARRGGLEKLVGRLCKNDLNVTCIFYSSDAADYLICVDLCGRRISQK